jgi:hypothetical protein
MSDASKKEHRKITVGKTLFLDLLADRKARPIFIYVVLFIVLTSALFHWLEGWDWIDSIYFVVITFTTIGYGDFAPTTPVTKLITIFVAVNGVAILLMLFDEIRRVRSQGRFFIHSADSDDSESGHQGQSVT